MKIADAAILDLFKRGWRCRDIANHMGEHLHFVYRRLRAMNACRERTRPENSVDAAVLCGFNKLGRLEGRHHAGTTAMTAAIHWFTTRGYSVALPVRVESYDLLVESDHGFKRIQVKYTSTMQGRFEKRGYIAYVARNVYVRKNENLGRPTRRLVPYKRSEVDAFFIQTAQGEMYLIPIGVLETSINVVLTKEFDCYRIHESRALLEPEPKQTGADQTE